MTYYKLLNSDGTPSNGGSGVSYYLPDGDKPGKWMPKIEDIALCSRGYHVVDFEHLLDWRGMLLCEAEIRGDNIRDNSKIVAQQIRLLHVVQTWNEKNLRLFAADCAEHVLPIFEKKYPKDNRPRLAIQAARAFAEGKISANAMLEARSAAYAAYAVADAVADAAAYAAAYAAYAYAAYAAYAVADAAAYAAYAVADAAAYAAAAYAAAADAAAARQKERQWQVLKLKESLGI